MDHFQIRKWNLGIVLRISYFLDLRTGQIRHGLSKKVVAGAGGKESGQVLRGNKKARGEHRRQGPRPATPFGQSGWQTSDEEKIMHEKILRHVTTEASVRLSRPPPSVDRSLIVCGRRS